MNIYSFYEKDLIRSVKAQLARSQIPFSTMCGNSVAVWFPNTAARNGFESFVLRLSGGATRIRVFSDKEWQELQRPVPLPSEVDGEGATSEPAPNQKEQIAA